MPLTSKELTAMRASLNLLMPDTCNILELTQTTDNQGGFTDSWGTATASVSCRIETMMNSGRETPSAGGKETFHKWVLSLPQGTTITTANRIEIGSDTYNVTSVDNGKSWVGQIRCGLEAV